MSDGTCSCNPGFTGADCGLPVPMCVDNCALLGEGFSCFGSRCEQQCSTNGRVCVPAAQVTQSVPQCAPYIDSSSYVCIPQGDRTQVLNDLKTEVCFLQFPQWVFFFVPKK